MIPKKDTKFNTEETDVIEEIDTRDIDLKEMEEKEDVEF